MTAQPVGADGADRRRARQLKVLIAVYGTLMVATLLTSIVRGHGWAAVLAQGALLLFLGVCYILLRRGRLTAAALLFLASWIALPLGALLSPAAGWMQFVTLPYLLLPTTVAASMLFHPRASFGVLLVTVSLYLGVVGARGGLAVVKGSALVSGEILYLIMPLASGLILATLSWLFGRDMADALAQADESAREAEAQLDASIDVVAELVLAATRVASLAEDLTTTMAYINSGAEEIAETTGQVAVGAGDQAHEVERVSESAAELAVVTRRIAADAQEVHAASTESEQLVHTTVEMLRALQRRLEAIDRVVKLVDKLADQTSLLALNAAIEAARAGAAGAGFSVVAEEVQRLAERSAAAAREIGEISHEVRESLDPVREAISAVDVGARRSRTLVQGVATMTGQQEQASDAMVTAVGGIAVVAEHNAVATEQIAASIEEQLASIEQVAVSTRQLSEVAGDLRAIIARQLASADGRRSIRQRLCPSLGDSPMLAELCFDNAQVDLVRDYCMGDFEACARKQLRNAGEPVPLQLRPDGSWAEEG